MMSSLEELSIVAVPLFKYYAKSLNHGDIPYIYITEFSLKTSSTLIAPHQLKVFSQDFRWDMA
jgi:hypothetical protein